MTTKEEIQSIDNRIIELRKLWVSGSQGYKKYIETAAKLLTDKKKSLEKKLENGQMEI